MCSRFAYYTNALAAKFKLVFNEVIVGAAFGDERLVASALCHFAAIEHHNLVGILHRA